MENIGNAPGVIKLSLCGRDLRSEYDYRADVQGLRALAVIAVLLFHLFPSLAPGGALGVDVFFVISGYLITGVLLRQRDQRGTLSLSTFYSRRIRRLLPAATVVLLAIVGGLWLLPAPRWEETAWQIIAAALYVENWQLAHLAVDYFSADVPPSPVQHYWSLSVEEQFYLVWPLCIVGVGALARWRAWRFGGTLFATLVAVTLFSLASSIHGALIEPSYAFFASYTRVWELALGALLAIRPSLIPRGERLSGLLGWLGLLAILGSVMLLPRGTPLPGFAALPATLGALLVIGCGLEGRRTSVTALLSWKPLCFIGDLSYGIYLWHWPLIVFYSARFDGAISAGAGALLAFATVLLAWLTKLLVEDPIRFAQPGAIVARYPFKLGAVAIAASLLSAAGVFGWTRLLIADHADVPAVTNRFPGARVLIDGVGAPPVPEPVPPLSRVRDDLAEAYRNGCHADLQSTKAVACEIGAVESDFHLVFAGDSHAVHWLPAVEAAATRRGWRVTTFTRSACALLPVARRQGRRPDRRCLSWARDVIADIHELRPDLVITAQSRRHRLYQEPDESGRRESMSAVLSRLWRELEEEGVQVAALRDTPWMPKNVPTCLARRQEGCALPRSKALAEREAILAAAQRTPSAAIIDLTDAICGPDRCSPVVGNIIVFRDSHHLTATYARTISGAFEAAVDEVMSRRARLLEPGVGEGAVRVQGRWSRGPRALSTAPRKLVISVAGPRVEGQERGMSMAGSCD